MDILDLAYEWLEESATERKQKNLDEDSGLIAAFMAGYEVSQQGAHMTGLWNCKRCKLQEIKEDRNYCPVCDAHR